MPCAVCLSRGLIVWRFPWKAVERFVGYYLPGCKAFPVFRHDGVIVGIVPKGASEVTMGNGETISVQMPPARPDPVGYAYAEDLFNRASWIEDIAGELTL